MLSHMPSFSYIIVGSRYQHLAPNDLDLLIALCKGKCKYTCPIANYISYNDQTLRLVLSLPLQILCLFPIPVGELQ